MSRMMVAEAARKKKRRRRRNRWRRMAMSPGSDRLPHTAAAS